MIRSLARLVFGSEGLSRRLETSAWVQAVAHRLQARRWVNAALARYPIRRVLAGSGVKYNIATFEMLDVERIYFRDPVYREIFQDHVPATFIDLGCNAGLFSCFLAHANGGRAPRGLCIDANREQAALAEKTIRLNGWEQIHVRCGLVGAREGDAGEAEFFLHPTSLGSSQFAYQDSTSGRAPGWTRTMAPTLKVAATWTGLFGPDMRCACLKIDIEGSEMNFFRAESGFLVHVDAILLEWHAWSTSRAEVTDFLERHGFALARVVEDAPRVGVLFFRRP